MLLIPFDPKSKRLLQNSKSKYNASMLESDLIKMITKISQNTGYQLTGDDAAVIDDLVISTDQFIEETHFSWDIMTPQEIGFKAIVQAMSDIAAMASKPIAILTSVAWPEKHDSIIPLLFDGIQMACKHYETPLVGGDITRSSSQLYIDVVVIGKNTNPVLKSGAQAGDILAISGPLGSACGGHISLQKKINFPNLIKKFKQPIAQIKLAQSLPSSKLTSLTDISDSLNKSLQQIAQQSSCGFTVNVGDIPFDNELALLCQQQQLDIGNFLLFGGEDYQLLMTFSASTSLEFIQDYGLNVIGTATKEQNISYLKNNQVIKLKDTTWDPFNL